MDLYKWIWAIFLCIFIHGLGFRLNSLLDQAKISIWVQTIGPRIHYGMWAIIYVLKPQNIPLGLFLTMKPKIQLSTHDVEFQHQELTKSDQVKMCPTE